MYVPHGAVGWPVVCGIVAFPAHTHLRFLII